MDPAFLVVDKPAGVTSHDIVAALRAVMGEKKVGHSGTLDPFATGVLALAFGHATRLMQYLDESIKVYDATIRLGSATDTGDPTGTVIRTAPVPELHREHVLEVLGTFLGERDQVPPPYSAVKFKGKPLYWYARRGETVDVPPRRIIVHAVELEDLGTDSLRVAITCGRGTYARVLADEIATALGTAGHLEALARRRSGPFYLRDAVTMDQVAEIAAPESGLPWQSVLMGKRGEPRIPWRHRAEVREAMAPFLIRPLDALSHLPLLDVDAEEARRIRQGAAPRELAAGVGVGGRYLIVHGADLIGVAEASAQGPSGLCVLPGTPA